MKEEKKNKRKKRKEREERKRKKEKERERKRNLRIDHPGGSLGRFFWRVDCCCFLRF